MRLLIGILTFFFCITISLSLIYVFNYALVEEDVHMRGFIDAQDIPVFDLYDMLLAGLPFVVGLVALLISIRDEIQRGAFG